jgi:flagellar biosynthetic protein FliR
MIHSNAWHFSLSLHILVFAKIISLFFLVPGFGQREVPHQIRIILSVALTLSVAPLAEPFLFFDLSNFSVFLVNLVREILIGCFLGMICKVLLLGLEFTGQQASSFSSLSNASLFNPFFEHSVPIHSNFLMIVGTAALIVSDFHHLLIRSLVRSYELFSPTLPIFWTDWADGITQTVTQSFVCGFQMSTPFMILGVVFQIVSGILNKLISQIPIFYLVMPAQILIGHLVFWSLTTALIRVFINFFERFWMPLFG